VYQRDPATSLTVTYNATYQYWCLLEYNVTDAEISSTIGNAAALNSYIKYPGYTITSATLTGSSICDSVFVDPCTSDTVCQDTLDGVTTTCASLCTDTTESYCKNEYVDCTQPLPTVAPTCDCLRTSSYWYTGDRCQTYWAVWMIVVICVGGVLILLFLIFLIWFCCTRKKKKLHKKEPKSAFVNDGFDNISNTTGVVRPMSDERSSTGSDSTNEGPQPQVVPQPTNRNIQKIEESIQQHRMENESSIYSAMTDSSFDDDLSSVGNLRVIPEYEEDNEKDTSMIRWKKLSGSVLQTLSIPVDDVPMERAPPTENFTVKWTIPKTIKEEVPSPVPSRRSGTSDRSDDDSSDSSSVSMALSRRSSMTVSGLIDAPSPVVWNPIKRNSMSDDASSVSSRPARVDITNRVGWQPALGPDMFSLYKESSKS